MFDAISLPESQKAGLDVLVSGGKFLIVLKPQPFTVDRGPRENKTVVQVVAERKLPHNIQPLRDLWAHATAPLEAGDIKVC
jgi:hypothetical protein